MQKSVLEIAIAAGNALVQAMVTDGWTGLREKVARLFARGAENRQIGQRLDASCQQLSVAGADDLEKEQASLAGQWAVRFADLLADHPEAEGELTALLTEMQASSHTVAEHAAVAGRDQVIVADHGSIAAGVIQGNVSLGSQPAPTPPDPTRPGSASS